MKKIYTLALLSMIFCVISGCAPNHNHAFITREIEFQDNIYVSLSLPPDFELVPNPHEENRLQQLVEFLPQQTFGIAEDEELIGSITLVDRRVNFGVGLEEEQWIESGRENPCAVFEGLFRAQLNDNWEQGYEAVYTSEDGMEGSALSYVLYNSAMVGQEGNGNWQPDLSACAREDAQNPEDPRCYYYNRAVLGYNLNLKYWVAVELNYAGITDAEHREIAESLRVEERKA